MRSILSKRKLKLPSILLILVILQVTHGQAQYRFDSWTADNGLPQNSVYAIANTPDGYLWMTTLDGLVRFDGVRFTVFNKSNSENLTTNRFINMFADADGTLWLGTEESGLIRYRNGRFRAFTTADGLPSNQITQVQRDLDNSLLIFTEGSLARLRDGNFSVENQDDFRNYKIYVSPSGVHWEMDKNGLRSVSKDGREAHYDLPFAAEQISPDQTFNYFAFVPLLEDGDGALWLAAAGALFKLKDGAMTTVSAKDGMPRSRVLSLVKDRAGAIWLGTEKDGLCRFGENRFACFGTGEGLSSNYIRTLLVDREGTLWAGTNERGINRITPRVVASVSTAEGLAGKNVYPILEDHAGGVWIGSFSGLSYYKDGKIKNYAKRDGLLYDVVQSLFLDGDGRLWIGSIGGIEILENGKFTDITEKLGIKIGDIEFWDIHQDRAGAMWFATRKGLIRYSNGTAKVLTTADGLPGDDVKVIHEARDGSLWFGCSGGLARFLSEPSAVADGLTRPTRNANLDVASPNFNRPLPQTVLTEQDGLAGNNVRTIYEDADGTLWIGTYDSGLSRLKDGKFTNFSTKNGLFSDGVFQILPDERGNFWMSSNQGIYRVSRAALKDFADGKISAIVSTVFGKSDGMLNIECNGGRSPAGIKMRDGRLWFPTQDGVAIINPEAVPSNPLAPPVVIESVKIDGVLSEPFAVANGLTSSSKSGVETGNLQPPATAGGSDIELAPNQRNLEIAYTGLSFIKPEQVRFRYRLEGLSEDWTEAGTRREAYFPYLPPGNYTFRVVAANSDNVWNEQGAAITIVVKPAFYQTWWFLVLCSLAIGLLAFWLYQSRLNEIRRRQFAQEEFSRRLINAHESERRRIAAELHDSLGQSLAMIKNSAVFGSQSIEDLPAAKEYLTEISEQSAHAIAEVREISYNLRPYLLDRLGFTKAVNSLLNKVADISALKIVSEIEDVDGIFETEAEISIYRIIQECLNNIMKHAEASEIKVSIRKNERGISIKIQDDGKGFDVKTTGETKQRDGFGLFGMSERVRILGGTISVESAIEKGTTILINLWKHK